MEEFILRDNPLIKIRLFNDRFEIQRLDNELNSYDLTKIDNLHIGKRVNWLVSILSLIVGVFTETSTDVYKERDQLKFNYEEKLIIISLKGGEQAMAITAANKVNQLIQDAYKNKKSLP